MLVYARNDYVSPVNVWCVPMRAAKPLTKVRVPKPEVRRSRPHISTMAGEVTAHQADRKLPNITDTITKAQYSSQKGMARGAIPPIPARALLSS